MVRTDLLAELEDEALVQVREVPDLRGGTTSILAVRISPLDNYEERSTAASVWQRYQTFLTHSELPCPDTSFISSCDICAPSSL